MVFVPSKSLAFGEKNVWWFVAAAMACALLPAQAEPEQKRDPRFAKTRFIDYNEPMRRFERERDARAMAATTGDEHFAKLIKTAVWIPPHRQYPDRIALDGPYASSFMYDLAAREQRLRPAPVPEPLPVEMKATLARRYMWYKVCLAEAKANRELPERVASGTVRHGVFRLSATDTNLQGAKRLLEEIAGPDAVDQLELELYPQLRTVPPEAPWPDTSN